jgi:hypothetical protein
MTDIPLHKNIYDILTTLTPEEEFRAMGITRFVPTPPVRQAPQKNLRIKITRRTSDSEDEN